MKGSFDITYQQHYCNLKATISETLLNSHHIFLPPCGHGRFKDIPRYFLPIFATLCFPPLLF